MIKKIIYNNKIMLTIAVVLFLTIFLIGRIKVVQANENIQYAKSFITIEIENGDTLTSIAEEYAVSQAEYANYISEIKQINNLKNDTIHAGCYLLIPVYTIVQ